MIDIFILTEDRYIDPPILTPYIAQILEEEQILAEELKNNEGLQELLKENSMFEIRAQKINTPSSEIGVSYFSDEEVLISSSERSKYVSQQTHNWTNGFF